MKKRLLALIPVMCLLAACEAAYKPEEEKYYAFFMNNYPRVTDVAPSGAEEKVENTLYKRVEIEIGKTISKPEVDPERNNYAFKGWFKDKEGLAAWDFDNDIAISSLFLYARWENTKSEAYEEPEYVYPEKIITDANYRVTGILNMPIKDDGSVDLTTGAINRLEKHKEDVKFAINYERKESVTLNVATYDISEKNIHLEVSSGETFDIKVNDVTASLSVASANKTYEDKAVKYETLGSEFENYHIALGGSSSMENWSTSTLDMSPIKTFNHGIGGTTVEQWTDKLLQRLVLPYSPKAVVYYVGVNNIINGDQEPGAQVGQKLNALFDKTHEHLPNTKIFYVLINRLPGYPHKQNDFDVANNAALEYAKNNSYLSCIDAGKDLVKEDGTPNAAYFLTDGLHMSKYGYVIWGQAVKDAIINWLDSTR